MRHVAVVGLGHGDEGKGAVVDRLCAVGDVSAVVRWNGGCQAAHNVVQDDGRQHTFAQLGSGTFHGVPTYLAEPVMVEPLSCLKEAAAIEPLVGFDPLTKLYVSPDCRVTTPYHWFVNRWREDQRGDLRHGSCGRGVGETAAYALRRRLHAPYVRDLWHEPTLRAKLGELRAWALAETRNEVRDALPDVDHLLFDYEVWWRRVAFTNDVRDVAGGGRIVFEGAQGVLLDEHAGFHPYTTWSTVTPEWVRELCAWEVDELEVVGVTRAYATRHGAGPFVTEDATLDLPEAHNKHERYQGAWRVGHLDANTLDYAVRACGGVDSVYVTHVDTAEREPRLRWCVGYDLDGVNLRILRLPPDDLERRAEQARLLRLATPVLWERPHDDWAESVAEVVGVPLLGVGRGPRTRDGAFTVRLSS